MMNQLRRFYLAFDCESSKQPTLKELLDLLSSSGLSLMVVCASRVEMDHAVGVSLSTTFHTVAIMDGSEERDLMRCLEAAKSQPSAVLMTESTLDALLSSQHASLQGSNFTFLVNYDLSKDAVMDDRRIALMLGPDQSKRRVVVDLFSADQEDHFRAIESHFGQIPSFPMSLEEILA
jgi:hypothetical protein